MLSGGASFEPLGPNFWRNLKLPCLSFRCARSAQGVVKLGQEQLLLRLFLEGIT